MDGTASVWKLLLQSVNFRPIKVEITKSVRSSLEYLLQRGEIVLLWNTFYVLLILTLHPDVVFVTFTLNLISPRNLWIGTPAYQLIDGISTQDRHPVDMWSTCDWHVVDMCLTCVQHVIDMSSTCDRHGIDMGSTCDRHVINMWSTAALLTF
jgi:hypothetical protein